VITQIKEGGIGVDMDAFMAFVGKFAGDLGAVVAAGNVVVGDRLGLYRGLAARGPSTAAELAARTGTDLRYFQFPIIGFTMVPLAFGFTSLTCP
jgi:hypothetical protein